MKSPKLSRLIGQRNPASLPSFDNAIAQFIGEPPAFATSSRFPSGPIGLLVRLIRLLPPTTNICAPPETALRYNAPSYDSRRFWPRKQFPIRPGLAIEVRTA